MKVKENRGITLIVLIITIIILLILAGIAIATLTGENGILKKASSAGEQTKIQEYKEILIIIGNGLRSEKILESLSTKEYMDRYQEAIEKEIEKEDTFEGTEIERKSDETIKVTTKEGYVYLVTENDVKYLGKKGETAPLDLQESNVNFVLSPDSWTNQDVKVEIESKIEGYQLQYSFDATTWENYKEVVIAKENGTIYTRLINELDESGGSATKTITTIDKELPNEATIQFSSTTTDITKSVTAAVTQSDKGTSGVDITKCKWIYTTNSSNIGINEASYTGESFSKNPEDITLNTTISGTYYLHILTIDRAGNKKETIAKQPVIVNDIDRTPPNEAQITLSATRTDVGKTVTATVKVSDNQSGIDISKCKYIINNSESGIGVNASNWSSAVVLTGTTSNVSITSNTKDALYLHILSVDQYNNKTETVSEVVRFGERTLFLYAPDPGGSTSSQMVIPSDWTLYCPDTYLHGNKFYSANATKSTLTSNSLYNLKGLSTLEVRTPRINHSYRGTQAWVSIEIIDTLGQVKHTGTWTGTISNNNAYNISISLKIPPLSGNYRIRLSVWSNGTYNHRRSFSLFSTRSLG